MCKGGGGHRGHRVCGQCASELRLGVLLLREHIPSRHGGGIVHIRGGGGGGGSARRARQQRQRQGEGVGGEAADSEGIGVF